MSTMSIRKGAALAAAMTILALATPAAAVTTRVWVTTTFGDFNAGDGAGVLVTSDGRLRRSDPVRRVAVGKVSQVFALHAVGGDLYLGTGTAGEVWRFRRGRATKLATLPGAFEDVLLGWTLLGDPMERVQPVP